MLEIDALQRSFGATRALDGLSLTVAGGSMHGFVGANGAGKTTTMRIVVGIERADAGEVQWDGQPLAAQPGRLVGYMPEERGLYPSMRVTDQLTYLGRLHGLASRDARSRAVGWLDRLGLAERIDDPVEKLSLGNQQRVQLIAALLHEPRLLVLDEPFSGLDPVAVDLTSTVLAEQVERGCAVLFSSHQLELVERLCDEVSIVADGRTVASGQVGALRSQGPRRYLVATSSGSPQWVDTVPGAVVQSRHDDGALLVRLDQSCDEQALLEAAMADGALRQFTPHQPSLSELYRATVTPASPEETR